MDFEKITYDIISGYLTERFNKFWLNNAGNIEVKVKHLPIFKGATDATFFEVDTKVKFAIKYHDNARNEKKGYQILKDLKQKFSEHLVEVFFPFETIDKFLIEPYLDITTFFDFTKQNLNESIAKEYILDTYKNFLEVNKEMWKNTAEENMTSEKLLNFYLGRIKNRKKTIQEKLNLENDFYDYELELNGTKPRYKIKELINIIESEIKNYSDQVKYSCAIHGDEHANNILIKNHNIEQQGLYKGYEDWVIIDYANVNRYGDWVYSIGKMLHWWQIYYKIKNIIDKIEDKIDLRFKINEKIIQIEYDQAVVKKGCPSLYKELIKEVENICEEVCDIFKENETFLKKRIAISLFSLYMGAIVYHCEEDTFFALPILFGEALESLKTGKLIN